MDLLSGLLFNPLIFVLLVVWDGEFGNQCRLADKSTSLTPFFFFFFLRIVLFSFLGCCSTLLIIPISRVFVVVVVVGFLGFFFQRMASAFVLLLLFFSTLSHFNAAVPKKGNRVADSAYSNVREVMQTTSYNRSHEGQIFSYSRYFAKAEFGHNLKKKILFLMGEDFLNRISYIPGVLGIKRRFVVEGVGIWKGRGVFLWVSFLTSEFLMSRVLCIFLSTVNV